MPVFAILEGERGPRWPSKPGDRALKMPESAGKRTETFKVRLNPAESYLLGQITARLGFGERALSFRWFLEHFDDLERSAVLVEKFRKMRQLWNELE